MEHLGPHERPAAPLPELVWLRKMIVERALTRGDYVLSGGIRSDYYIDKFSLFSDPHVLRRIARLFTPVIAEVNPDLIAGTELGGVVIATAVSQMSGIPMIAVRKKPKGYGAFAEEYVEGPYEPGQHALLLEDVVTNGRELMAAAKRLEEAGLRVTPCAVISRGLAPVRALIQFSLPRSQPKTQN
jgi:orotate phosphoribosyltransferase